MTLGGNLDFGGQASQSTRFLTALAVDTVGSQSFDISSLIGPQDQALLVYWVATAPFTGLPCGVIAQTNAPPIFFSGHTQLADGAQAILPFQGAIMLYPVNIGGTIIVDNIGPGPVHIVGTLFVSALTAPPYQVPVVRRNYIGTLTGTGSVNAGSAGTTQILAAASAGLYYRLRCLSARVNVVPAAAQSLSWQVGLGGPFFIQHQAAAAVPQTFNTSIDCVTEGPILLLNNLSVAILCTIAYEVWQA